MKRKKKFDWYFPPRKEYREATQEELDAMDAKFGPKLSPEAQAEVDAQFALFMSLPQEKRDRMFEDLTR